MRKARSQKNTLLKTAISQRCEPKFLREYFFLPPKKKFNFFSPTLRCFNFFRQRTVLNRTDIALNVNRSEQTACGLQTAHLRTDSKAAGNIKIKRNNFFEGFVRLSNSCASNEMSARKIFATEESGVNDFIYLLQKFSPTVSLLIPQKNYFVNPFFVMRYAWATVLTLNFVTLYELL